MTGMAAGGVDRGAWSNPIQFFITLLGSAVGLGNIWRFPNVVYTNGGAAFLIAYAVAMVLLAIPILLMEAVIGQFSQRGPIAVWDMSPLFRGIGFATFMYTFINTVYYNTPLSWAAYYFVNSMTNDLPWADCNSTWSTPNCTTNDTLAKMDNSSIYTSPEDEYFYLNVLKLSGDALVVGEFSWEVYLCNAVLWLVIFGGVSLGAQSLGKVAYFTSLFPYVMITAMVGYTATLEGAIDGINFYLLEPDFSKLATIEIWRDAVAQVFYSTSCATGAVILLSSFNDFHHNIFRDAFLIPIMDALTSIYAGFAVFMVLGHMAKQEDTEVENVVDGGPGLLFITYAKLYTIIDGGNVWAVFFFFMVMILGLSSQFPSIEMFSSAMSDAVPFFRKSRLHNMGLRLGIVLVMLAVTTPFYFGNGYYWYTLTDERIAGLPLMIIGLLEVVAVAWVYSGPVTRMLFKNILAMIGEKKKGSIIFIVMKWYLLFCWLIVAPLSLGFLLIFDLINLKPLEMTALNVTYVYPEWASGLAWGVVALMPAAIVIMAILVLVKYKGDFRKAISPKKTWWAAFEEKKTGGEFNVRAPKIPTSEVPTLVGQSSPPPKGEQIPMTTFPPTVAPHPIPPTYNDMYPGETPHQPSANQPYYTPASVISKKQSTSSSSSSESPF